MPPISVEIYTKQERDDRFVPVNHKHLSMSSGGSRSPKLTRDAADGNRGS